MADFEQNQSELRLHIEGLRRQADAHEKRADRIGKKQPQEASQLRAEAAKLRDEANNQEKNYSPELEHKQIFRRQADFKFRRPRKDSDVL